MIAEEFIPLAIREFERYKGLADRAIEQLGEGQFFAVPGEGDNSIAVIVKHMSGNMLSRWTDFLTTDGEKPGLEIGTQNLRFFPTMRRASSSINGEPDGAPFFRHLRRWEILTLEGLSPFAANPSPFSRVISRQLHSLCLPRRSDRLRGKASGGHSLEKPEYSSRKIRRVQSRTPRNTITKP